MLTWSEFRSNRGFSLTAKCQDVIIATVDAESKQGIIVRCRIRSIWNSKEELYPPNYTNDSRVRTPVKQGDKTIDSVADIKKYCEVRWEQWLGKNKLVETETHND